MIAPARKLLVVLLVVAGIASACGQGSDVVGVQGDAIEPIPPDALPAKIQDLTVRVEDMKKQLSLAKDTYVRSAGVFSLRAGELVQATLQITRFTDDFDFRSGEARTSLANRMGGSRAELLRLGDDTVYLTQGQRQQLALWYRGSYLYVLSTRRDYTTPRALLRDALKVDVA
jgi:hypothetical protein